MAFNTPQSFSDSGHITDPFNFQCESTPIEASQETPLNCNASRKRKYTQIIGTKLTDKLESNESLTNQLEHCQIRCNFYNETLNIHATPEKQFKLNEDFLRKSNYSSPMKEAQDILYPNLAPSSKSHYFNSPKKVVFASKKCLFTKPNATSLEKVLQNPIIAEHVFKHLSGGDLYRLSQTSKALNNAVDADLGSKLKYRCYMEIHRINKENYKITPPNSPEKEELGQELGENSKNFNYFYEYSKALNNNQSLRKCAMCSKPAIVESNIAQCQSCGYISCLLCPSFAYKPEDFHNECCNAQLSIDHSKTRPKFGDLSNSDFDGSIFSSTFVAADVSSGYYSGSMNESSLAATKRKLSFSFNGSSILTTNNRSVIKEVAKEKRRSLLTPVVVSEGVGRKEVVVEPSSPPKVKQYAACSKQSRRNLKRLTR